MLARFAMTDVSYHNARLIQAARNGNLADAATALNNGADINAKDIVNHDITALMWASENGHRSVVKLLIEWGSDVNIKTSIDNIEYTALKLADEMGCKDIGGILESIGAKE